MVSDGMKACLFLSLACILLCACSKKEGEYRRRSFLKDRAGILEGRIEWTEDVSAAGEGKFQTVTVAPGLEPYPIAHILTCAFDRLERTYPYIEGFASLDTRAYSEASFAALDGFCRALEEGKGEDSFMDKGFLFSLALFKQALASRSGGKGRVKILSHLVGMPFFPSGAGDSLQCPVRLTLSDGSDCDIYVYLVKSASDWKVNQIDFMNGDGEENP